jgi:hypothetical protein
MVSLDMSFAQANTNADCVVQTSIIGNVLACLYPVQVEASYTKEIVRQHAVVRCSSNEEHDSNMVLLTKRSPLIFDIW